LVGDEVAEIFGTSGDHRVFYKLVVSSVFRPHSILQLGQFLVKHFVTLIQGHWLLLQQVQQVQHSLAGYSPPKAAAAAAGPTPAWPSPAHLTNSCLFSLQL
jgi:hypothetical protein